MKKRLFLMLMLLAALLPGCSLIKNVANKVIARTQPVISCAENRMNTAFERYDEAKLQLANHFDDRDPNRLQLAYYASSDSINLAKSVSQCPDRQTSHFNAMKNLLEVNRNLQKTVMLNLRDDDPQDLIAIYKDQYARVMPNDIK